MSDKSQNTVPNIWTAQERVIQFYRMLAMGLGLLSVFGLLLTVVIYFRDPIVVTKSKAGQEFYSSARGPVSIEKEDVENFAKRFLDALFGWSEFDVQLIVKDISPFAEDGLIEKVVAVQSQRYGKELKAKKLSQAITFVKITVLNDRVVCSFDRVLKIEGIPLVIPTDVTLSVTKGTPTRLNPMGIYVSGIMEHEGAK